MSRRADWEPALCAWLDATAARPFAWGSHDCSSFAAECVRVQTGQDFYKPFRGRYTTEIGAMKALRRQGHDSVMGPFDAALGERLAPLLLGRGDLVSDGVSVGLLWWQGGPVALFVGGEAGDAAGGHAVGLVTRPLADMAFGWKVGSVPLLAGQD
jgi:hypothetical protein